MRSNGPQQQVSIMVCLKYGRLLGCLLHSEYVVSYNLDKNTYILKGLRIGGRLQPHKTS